MSNRLNTAVHFIATGTVFLISFVNSSAAQERERRRGGAKRKSLSPSCPSLKSIRAHWPPQRSGWPTH